MRGPIKTAWTSYTPQDKRWPLANDDLEVSAAHWAWDTSQTGPAHNSEAIKALTLRFTPGHAPYIRHTLGHVLACSPAPQAPLLLVEALHCKYRYDHEFREWWASEITADAVYADNIDGRPLEPRRELQLCAWDELDEATPSWVKSLTGRYRPGPDDVPPSDSVGS